jgi:hypothetical protein
MCVRMLRPVAADRLDAETAINHQWFGRWLEMGTYPDRKDYRLGLATRSLQECMNCDMEACPINDSKNVFSSQRFRKPGEEEEHQQGNGHVPKEALREPANENISICWEDIEDESGFIGGGMDSREFI